MSITITPKVAGTTLTLELVGKLSTIEAKEFDKRFQTMSEGMKEALLDFSAVDYISSAGLRSIFVAKKTMLQQGGELKVLYPSSDVMEVFKATRYDNIVTIVQKEEDNAQVFYPATSS